MRRAGWIALPPALVAALVLTGAAAPRASVPRSGLSAVDFEQRLPGLARAAGGAYVSPVIRAPRRFDLVGIVGERDPVEYRARPRGGRWTRWTEAHGGDPVWTGGADELQVRSDHGRPRGRLHYVRVRGSARASQDGSQDIVLDLDEAPGMPPVVSRAEWGADTGCKPRAAPAYGEVKAALVHHTVSANDYPPERAAAVVLGICRYHRNGNGWNDIGYNALVDRYGVLYEGRAGGLDLAVVGAQAQGYNAQSVGVASVGTHTGDPIGPAAMNSLIDFLGWKLSLHGVPARGEATLVSQGGSVNRYRSGTRVRLHSISGHRDVNSTACPGSRLYDQLAELRSRVKTGPVTKPLVSLAAPPAIVYPEVAELSGRVLSGGDGRPLARAPVRLQMEGRGGWRTVKRTETDSRGDYDAVVPFSTNRRLRARVPAYEAYDPATSAETEVLVRANVTARLSKFSELDAGGEAIVTGTVAPRKKRLVMAVLRRGPSGAYKRVARVPVRARRGAYKATYRFPRHGRYRFRVIFKRDGKNASARARDLDVRADADSGGLGSE